ncbi:asparagine synthase-related protein [Pedomonas mirosovicensis]|uniref:asparagine synthase-related protein n=1 Tax=Pedomonas mirosovicensis TaxID=2908641 RepID=UPI00216A7F2A|nr:asparagine synthase C-terminal domain-containing protein [Pedomonas mirosovicensis]MCH8686620.1 asparagine synthase C-terminal domain-containing protein [Pedomonas mirosovicensis]
MFDYIAVIDLSQGLSATTAKEITDRVGASLPDYKQVSRTREFHLFVQNRTGALFDAISLQNGSLLGRAFKRDYSRSTPITPRDLSAFASAATRLADPSALVRDLWGQYVLISVDASSRQALAFRSPLCGIPVYYVTNGDIWLFFSNPAHIAEIKAASFQIDWSYLTFHQRYHYIETDDAPLLPIKQLRHGHSLRISDRNATLCNDWDLRQIAKPSETQDARLLAMRLRETVVDCVSAWSSLFQKICLRLSGGLDSSIVASALRLAENGVQVNCFTYYGSTIEGDERQFARLAVRQNDYPLTEIPDRRGNQRYDLLWEFPLSGTPFGELLSAFRAPMEYPVIQSCGAQAVFDGEPGDAIFVRGNFNFARDYLFDKGVDLRFLQVAAWAARRNKRSIYAIMKDAIVGRREPPGSALVENLRLTESPLMSEQKFAETLRDRRITETIAALEGLAPAKLVHAFQLNSAPENFATSVSGERYISFSPLCSQPIYELCLRIPIYDLIWKGWDRGLARLAFADVLPNEILVREQKGGVVHTLNEVFADNLDLFRECFSDSLLVKHGVLDPKRVALGLAGETGQGFFARQSLLITIATEIWARRWTDLIATNARGYTPLLR